MKVGPDAKGLIRRCTQRGHLRFDVPKTFLDYTDGNVD